MYSSKLSLTTIPNRLGGKKYSTDIELSRYISKLNNGKIRYKCKWNIATYTSPYKGGSTKCNLCLTEKLKTMREDPELLLKKRSQLITKKFLLANIK